METLWNKLNLIRCLIDSLCSYIYIHLPFITFSLHGPFRFLRLLDGNNCLWSFDYFCFSSLSCMYVCVSVSVSVSSTKSIQNACSTLLCFIPRQQHQQQRRRRRRLIRVYSKKHVPRQTQYTVVFAVKAFCNFIIMHDDDAGSNCLNVGCFLPRNTNIGFANFSAQQWWLALRWRAVGLARTIPQFRG